MWIDPAGSLFCVKMPTNTDQLPRISFGVKDYIIISGSNHFSESRDLLDTDTYRKARHVVTEIRRAAEAFTAVGNNDFVKFGQLMLQSHNSLRSDGRHKLLESSRACVLPVLYIHMCVYVSALVHMCVVSCSLISAIAIALFSKWLNLALFPPTLITLLQPLKHAHVTWGQ